MKNFWQSETYAITKAIKARGNRPGLVQEWKDAVTAMVEQASPQDAAAVREWLPMWQVRPFYTAAELAPIWPALAILVGHTDRWPEVPKSAGRLQFELAYSGLPYFEIDGILHPYFVVERPHHWAKQLQLGNWKEIYRAFD